MKKRLRKLLEEIKQEMELYNGKLVVEGPDDENPQPIHFDYTIKRIEEELGEVKE